MSAIKELIRQVIEADEDADLSEHVDGQTYVDAEKEMDQALDDLLAERKRQDQKWGEQNHDPITYTVILVEEVGELAQAALHSRFGGEAARGLRQEALHSAAVALAIVQCIDREKWRWPVPV